MSQECNTCKFWRQLYQGTHARHGQCHRFPPVRKDASDAGNLWLFPDVADWQWCGEYKRSALAPKE